MFQEAVWQCCQVHFKHNILDSCPRSIQSKLSERLKLLFDAPDLETARLLLQQILEEYDDKAPKAIDCLENGFEDVLAVMGLPAIYRKRLRSTNSQELLNKEIRQRERMIGIFPNISSAERLPGAL